MFCAFLRRITTLIKSREPVNSIGSLILINNNTPVSQFDSEVLIQSSHCHDEHQVDLEFLVEGGVSYIFSYHGTTSAGQHGCKIPSVRVIEQPYSGQSSVDDHSQDEYQYQTYLKSVIGNH